MRGNNGGKLEYFQSPYADMRKGGVVLMLICTSDKAYRQLKRPTREKDIT